MTTPTTSAPASRGDLRDDGRRARARAAAHAGGDEDHVGAGERLGDPLGVLQGGLAADLGVRARPHPLARSRAELDLLCGPVDPEGLQVGVRGDELHAVEAGLDHPVDGVPAAAADADDLDPRRGNDVLTDRDAEATRDSSSNRIMSSSRSLSVADAGENMLPSEFFSFERRPPDVARPRAAAPPRGPGRRGEGPRRRPTRARRRCP